MSHASPKLKPSRGPSPRPSSTPTPNVSTRPDPGAVLRGWRPAAAWLADILPGVLLCGLITVASILVQRIETTTLGHPYVEAIVLAILVGAVVRTAWRPGPRWTPGIGFSAKILLEVAIVLLGATLDLPLLLRAGPLLLLGILLTVAAALATGYGVGRLLGLRQPVAILLACGNAICGNAAIAAVAPVIGAEADDVAAAIGFTAVLGVALVLGLPALGQALALSHYAYGVVAGLTVYAVPQVLAATFPVSVVSGQVGTLVKLVRVLLLGPVVVGLSMLHRRSAHGGDSVREVGTAGAPRAGAAAPPLRPLVHHRLPGAGTAPRGRPGATAGGGRCPLGGRLAHHSRDGRARARRGRARARQSRRAGERGGDGGAARAGGAEPAARAGAAPRLTSYWRGEGRAGLCYPARSSSTRRTSSSPTPIARSATSA